MMNAYQQRTAQYRKILRRSGVLAGAAEKPAGPAADSDPLQGAGSLVLSPAMNAYVIWLLREAMDAGIRRLYFLARDGYLVCMTAKKYCEKLGLPVDCRYLYCSRYSLRVPLYHRDLEETLDHVTRGGIRVTPRKIMVRSGLTPAQTEQILPRLALPYGADECIPFSCLPRVRELLRGSGDYLNAVADGSARALPNLKGYFAQEGLLDDCPMAIVDSGWTGTMQRCIQQIRQLCGCTNELHGFYYGIYSLPRDACASQYHAFAFSRRRHLWRKVFFNNNFFETVFCSPHGSTQGYQEENGRYVPVLSQPDPRIRDFILNLETQMSACTDALLEDLTHEGFMALPLSRLRRTVCKLFRLLMWAPTAAEAECFGSLPFSDDLLDSGLQELAAPLTDEQLRSNHLLPKLLAMTGLRPRPLHESAWYEASAVRFGRCPLRHRISYTCYRILLYLKPR